mmetsp:Transcript_128564/g.333299  ORF Transcript_128564/g.333299 Transcript_128564/m.333299 type:complete len:357 (-) Transcript_128564:654-1724(-)
MKFDTGRPRAFSWSPWAKNSASRRWVHFTWRSQSMERWPKSAHFIAICSTSVAPPASAGAKPSLTSLTSPPRLSTPPPLPPSGGAGDRSATRAVKSLNSLLLSAMSVLRTSLMAKHRSCRNELCGRLERKSFSGRRSRAKAAATWWCSLTCSSLYLIARSCPVRTRKSFESPKWSKSWTAAANRQASLVMSAPVSPPPNAGATSEATPPNSSRACMECNTEVACMLLWYWLLPRYPFSTSRAKPARRAGSTPRRGAKWSSWQRKVKSLFSGALQTSANSKASKCQLRNASSKISTWPVALAAHGTSASADKHPNRRHGRRGRGSPALMLRTMARGCSRSARVVPAASPATATTGAG